MSRARVLVLVVDVVLAGCVGLPTETNVPGAEHPSLTPTESTVEVRTDRSRFTSSTSESVATLVIGPAGERMLIDSGHFHAEGDARENLNDGDGVFEIT